MISKYGRGWIAAPLGQIAVWLERTGISPNALTLIGFLLTVVVAAVLATGQLLWGGLLLIFAALFDTLDGALARHAGKWLAYPYLFEPEPGRLWLTTMQGGVRAEFSEADFAP